ncbi:MAG: ABC transporter ATP-binding protein [Leptolyngbyaceae cyanobacterium]
MDSSIILQLEHLSKHFPNQAVPAVDRVSLTLAKGDLLGLLGPSGCGKTTLLRLIAGFERPQTGTITLAGRAVCDAPQWVPPEHRGVGVVFQDYALFPHLTVLGNVTFGLKSVTQRQRFPAHKRKTEAARAIALVGLAGFENRYPHELSGGQQQRVALARALAPRPSLVLLDEPFSNLDVQVRLYLRQEVRDILKGVGASGVFVTHDQEEAMSISDRLAVMRQGQIEQLDTPERVYHQPASQFVAEFVTQANFLPTKQVGSRWDTVLGSFPVRPEDASLTEGQMMIRQEDLHLQADEQGTLIVRDRQFLGREYRYTLTTAAGQLLQARIPTDLGLKPGNAITATVTCRHPRVFAQGQGQVPAQPIAAPV